MSFDFHRCLFEVIEIGIFNRQHMESLKQNHVWQKEVCGLYRYRVGDGRQGGSIRKGAEDVDLFANPAGIDYTLT